MDKFPRKCIEEINVSAPPSQACILKTVANLDQVDAHLAKLLAISAAAYWSWGLLCMASDKNGCPLPESTIWIISDMLVGAVDDKELED